MTADTESSPESAGKGPTSAISRVQNPYTVRTKAPERGPAELPTCYRYSFTCYKAIAKDLNDLILAFNACSGHSHNQQQD